MKIIFTTALIFITLAAMIIMAGFMGKTRIQFDPFSLHIQKPLSAVCFVLFGVISFFEDGELWKTTVKANEAAFICALAFISVMCMFIIAVHGIMNLNK